MISIIMVKCKILLLSFSYIVNSCIHLKHSRSLKVYAFQLLRNIQKQFQWLDPQKVVISTVLHLGSCYCILGEKLLETIYLYIIHNLQLLCTICSLKN